MTGASPTLDSEPLLRIEDLTITFQTRRGAAQAVNGISFDVRRGECVGLVGESGCGKSVTSLAIVGLLRGADVGGRIVFDGDDLLGKTADEMRAYRGRHIAMVLQDPMSALNPVFTIENQVAEPLRIHSRLRGKALVDRVVQLLQSVRIPRPRERLHAYPHEFSGGMRQRVVSSIALAGEPELLIADEPTTALDVTIQAAYLDLLGRIQDDENLTLLFVTHDLGVVGEICDRVVVMYAGRIVEIAPTAELFTSPRHPYTQALLSSAPDVRRSVRRLPSIDGTPPSSLDIPDGCPFHPRCPLYRALGQPAECRSAVPRASRVSDGHVAACHFVDAAVARQSGDDC